MYQRPHRPCIKHVYRGFNPTLKRLQPMSACVVANQRRAEQTDSRRSATVAIVHQNEQGRRMGYTVSRQWAAERLSGGPRKATRPVSARRCLALLVGGPRRVTQRGSQMGSAKSGLHSRPTAACDGIGSGHVRDISAVFPRLVINIIPPMRSMTSSLDSMGILWSCVHCFE